MYGSSVVGCAGFPAPSTGETSFHVTPPSVERATTGGAVPPASEGKKIAPPRVMPRSVSYDDIPVRNRRGQGASPAGEPGAGPNRQPPGANGGGAGGAPGGGRAPPRGGGPRAGPRARLPRRVVRPRGLERGRQRRRVELEPAFALAVEGDDEPRD